MYTENSAGVQIKIFESYTRNNSSMADGNDVSQVVVTPYLLRSYVSRYNFNF